MTVIIQIVQLQTYPGHYRHINSHATFLHTFNTDQSSFLTTHIDLMSILHLALSSIGRPYLSYSPDKITQSPPRASPLPRSINIHHHTYICIFRIMIHNYCNTSIQKPKDYSPSAAARLMTSRDVTPGSCRRGWCWGGGAVNSRGGGGSANAPARAVAVAGLNAVGDAAATVNGLREQ